MNSTISNATPHEFEELETDRVVPTIKVLMFSVGSLNLGLRIESIYKVLNAAQIHGSRENWVGLVHLGDREVTVLDLKRRLFPSQTNSDDAPKGYLMVIQNAKGELYGIPVDIVPALVDVPLPNLRLLPESFRHADTLRIASHVAVITESESEIQMTLFLLDIEALTAV